MFGVKSKLIGLVQTEAAAQCTPLHSAGGLTVTLTVIVKGNPDCTSQNFLQYQAQSDSLPSTFDDGQVRVGPYRSLELVEVDPGAHVEIHIRYINTIVVVRRIGTYLTFSIQMPESLINGSSGALGGPVGRGFSASAGGAASFQGVQLCLRGCPEAELINFQDYLASRRDSISEKGLKPSSSSDGDSMDNLQGDGGESFLSRATAEELCREASVVGFYFDFCVFDLMATGDRNFTLAAVSAMQDALRLDPSAASTLDNRTSLEKYDQQFYRGAATSNTPSLWRTSVAAGAAFLFMATGVIECGKQRHNLLLFLTVLTLLLFSLR
ncbi:repulsive guidance molecule A-like [Elysia marginata]|uniref:Repulsive guidance molecule A-like n=1 Tax=Elysia marginata TaxID=1093978 RepID=A0AAV4JQ26_9GAST|nr:repulsive guidance molecule A-like [Elysia marginata]